MATSRVVKNILGDINKTIAELQEKNLLRDVKGAIVKPGQGGIWSISFPGKNDSSSILYDKHITSTEILNTLLKDWQYTILFYDKGLIQAEFMIDKEKIIKERLIFIKKHNKIWSMDEINDFEIREEDWFADEDGIPIMFRIDYAPNEHIDGKHAATHLTLSNHESCRIPIKGVVSFSEFVRLILFHFYDIELNLRVWRTDEVETITELEKQMVHISWV